MNVDALFSALGATVLLVLAGYLFGARRGREARRALSSELDAREARLKETELELERARTSAATLEAAAQNGDLAERIEAQLRPLLDSAAERGALRSELHDALAPLLDKSSRLRDLESRVETLLTPLVEKEKLGTAIARASSGTADRASIADVLNALAEAGGFSTVVLSDEVGLPLAVNSTARDADTHAGIASMLLTLIDRVAANGHPSPTSAVFRDEENRVILHRVFRLEDTRLVLTAVASGMPLSPETLDPTLGTIERVLTRVRWAS